jgi:hypothetical protein
VTESLLRNPRFPERQGASWSRRWRNLRVNLASHPNVGAAWLFALASVGRRHRLRAARRLAPVTTGRRAVREPALRPLLFASWLTRYSV